jgi:hypothetical protein
MTSVRDLVASGMANDAMAQLAPFLGEWRLETSLGPLGAMRAVAVFEWALDGALLVERSEIDVPEAPDGLCVMAADGEEYMQHYFDSRGVVRIYEMSFADGVWKRWRETPDFSPLNFWQRFEGTFSDDGNVIAARWETSTDEGAGWELDFELTYTRVS